MSKLSALLKNKIVKNAGWLVAGKIIQMLISLFVSSLTARYLGPGNYGILNYAAAYTAFFSSFCTLGINSVIVKEFVDHKGREGEIIGTALGLRGISSILSAITITSISFFLDRNEPLTIAVVALSSLSVVFHIFETFHYWFQSKLQSKKSAIATLIAYSAMALYKVILLIAHKSVLYFAFATSLDYICVAIIMFIFYKKEGGGRLSFSLKYGKELLKKSYHFILPGIMIAVYAQTDKIMLKQMLNETEVGYYATAVTLCGLWCFVLNAIIDSLVPSIMQAHKEDKERFESLNRTLYCIIFYAAMSVSVLFVLFGDIAIRILYGDAFLPASLPLKIITWYTAFSYLGGAREAWVVCENRQKYLKYIYLSAAVSNVLLNFLLIPRLGAAGAAIASLCAQVITTMVVPFFIKGMRRNSVLMLQAMTFKGLIKTKNNDITEKGKE